MRLKNRKQAIHGAILALVFWIGIVACTMCFGQPVAKIGGPSQTLPGELTVLESKGSSGDNLLWIPPKNLTVVLSGCDPLDMSVFFATTRVGQYEFLLVASDSSGIAYARHTVTVGQPAQPPPDDPDPTPAPDPQPDPDPQPEPGRWSGLESLSRSNAAQVNDPLTRSALKSAIDSEIQSIKSDCQSGRCPSLIEAKRRVTGAIERELLRRVDRFSVWVHGWRTPNVEFLTNQPPKDLPDYLAAAQAIAAGL